MRRVFPLRPAETSLLVTYDNGTFEHEDACNAEDKPLPPPSAAAHNSKHRRGNSINFSGNSSLPSSPRKLRPKPSSSSGCPDFAEVASPSPPSSLWTSSIFDDGDSTSFNSSDDTHRRRPTYFSSSSSSSINFNLAESGSSLAIAPSKEVDALLDTASSSLKAPSGHADPDNGPCPDLKVNLHIKTRTLDAKPTAVKTSLKALAFGNSQELVHPETPTYVIPKKVEEYMQNCLDMPSNTVPSYRSVSVPKAVNRTSETSRRSTESPRRVPPKPTLQRRQAENCSCSTPFKYLTKCLRSDKRRNTPSKDGSERPNSPAKFLTLINELYSPQSSPKVKPQVNNDRGSRTASIREHCREKSDGCEEFPMNSASSGTLRSLTPRRMGSKVSNASSISNDNWQSPSKHRSVVSAMVNDYVRRLQDETKSFSSRKGHRAASFHYESNSCVSEQPRPRSGSVDFAIKSVNFCEDANPSMSKLSRERPDASSMSVSRQRPSSMDVATSFNMENGSFAGKADNESLFGDIDGSSDLFAAEEKNLRTLALLRLEISKLCKEKRFLARELAAEMKARHSQQQSAEDAIRHMEAEMEEKLISVEKNHAHAQACLEEEMDRRKKEWSEKLDKIRIEEKRLRDRVTEMALERVELQKAIALHKSREASLQAQAKDHEISAQTWMRCHRQCQEEVSLLRKSFTNACNKLGDKEHELDLLVQKFKALERENAELFKEIARVRKAYTDQEGTFEELWQRLVDIVNGPSDSKLQGLRKLHSELKVFAVREQALRYEIDMLQSQLLHVKQRVPLSSENGLLAVSSSRTCSPKELSRFSRNLSLKSLETVEDLIDKLESTKQRTRQAEHQLEIKEEEVELLHSALQERGIVVEDLHDELISVKAQRDGLRKQVWQMSQEAVRLTRDLTELRQVIEKLDDELMLKEGEISILRDTCSEGDFLE